MNKTVYEYFIVYNFTDKRNAGTGNTTFECDAKIDNLKDIRTIENILMEDYKHKSCVVTNYILLNEREVSTDEEDDK